MTIDNIKAEETLQRVTTLIAAKLNPRTLRGRLPKFENDVFRFLDNPLAPFTNNPAENDLRIIKVQQKAPGCFCSMERCGNLLPHPQRHHNL